MDRPAIEHDDVTVIEDGEYTYQESDESAAFREFKSSFDDEKMGSLRVHRVPESKTQTNKGATRTIYLFSCTIDQFDFDSLLEYLRDHYGGGTYRLIGSRSGTAGVAFNRLVEIEAPMKSKFMGGLDKGDPLNSHDASANIIDRMGAVLLESQTRQEELFRSMSGPQSGGDAFKQMTEMMTAMGTMMGSMGMKPAPQKSLLDQAQDLLALKEIFSGGDSGGGDANLYTMLTETIRQFGGPIAQAIAMGQQSGALNSDGVMTAPLLPKANPEIETEEAKVMKANEAMKANIEVLIKNARANVDPVTFAGVLISNLPEEKIDEFYEFISADDYLQRLISLVPEVEQYRAWFEKLRDAVIELLTEPDDQSTVAESKSETPAEPVAGETDTVISDDSDSEPTANS